MTVTYEREVLCSAATHRVTNLCQCFDIGNPPGVGSPRVGKWETVIGQRRACGHPLNSGRIRDGPVAFCLSSQMTAN